MHPFILVQTETYVKDRFCVCDGSSPLESGDYEKIDKLDKADLLLFES